MWAKPARGSGLVFGYAEASLVDFLPATTKTPLRGPAPDGEGYYFLIHGESLGSFAGKVKTCFSRAFSQANPTVEMHGA
jgi:hypothetical protein